MPRERVQNSLGSGVIVDPAGLIITNNHVIQGGTNIRVVLADKREFEAKLLLTDERTDLAVLKINVPDEKLPALKFGDSDNLEVGDLVLAIGNALSSLAVDSERTATGLNDVTDRVKDLEIRLRQAENGEGPLVVSVVVGFQNEG